MTLTEAIQLARNAIKQYENLCRADPPAHSETNDRTREALQLLADHAASNLLLPNMGQKPIHTADGGRLTTLRKRGPR